jgi:hypothetical protein
MQFHLCASAAGKQLPKEIEDFLSGCIRLYLSQPKTGQKYFRIAKVNGIEKTSNFETYSNSMVV